MMNSNKIPLCIGVPKSQTCYLPAIFGGHIKKLLPMSPKICRCKILCNHGKTDNRGHYTKKK